MGPLMNEAWMAFDKAVGFDEKARDTTKTDGIRRMSVKATDKHLDRAVELEAEALAAGEKH